MSNQFGLIVTANNSDLIAKMVEAGSVTEREAKKMQRALSYISDQLKVQASAQQAANDASTGMEKAATHMEHFGFQTAAAKRELLVLGHELSQGNYSRFGGSLMVLAERTNAMELAFSGAGLAIGAAAATIGGYIVAMVAGSIEADKFAKSLISTNNAVGMTADTFDSTAAAIAKSTNTTIRSSKAALQELMNTGRFGAESIGTAAIAVVNMERLTGQSAEEIVKDFAKMTEGVTKWAQEHNKQYHFLTVEQFKHIKLLEDQGEKERAASETLKLVSDQAKKAGENLGYMARAWRSAKEEASGFIDGMMNIGKAMTDSQRLAGLLVQLGQLDNQKPNSSVFGGDSSAKLQKRREALLADIDATERRIAAAKQLAAAQADAAKKAEKAIDDVMAKAAKAEKFDPLSAIQGGFAKSMTDARARPMKLGVQYDYLDAGKQQGRADFLKSEIGSYDELARAAARAAEAEQKRQEELTKRLAEEQIATDSVIARLDEETKYLGLNTVERQIAIEQIKIEASSRKLLAEGFDPERVRAAGAKRSADVEAGIRRNDAAQKSFAFGAAKSFAQYQENAHDAAKFAENFIGGSLQRMEDALVNFAKTGKLSFADLFSFMAEEYLRQQIRMSMADFLPGGKGMQGGSFLASLASFGSSLFKGHANGLDYVPYDGYPSLLHEGERVQTKQEARAGHSGKAVQIDMSIGSISVGQGVSRSEVHAAVAQANAESEKRIRRLMQQGALQ